MSVDRAKMRPVQDTLKGHAEYGAVALVAGPLRELGQEVEAAPELLNQAHALVKGKKSKSLSRTLARMSEWVIRVPRAADDAAC